MGTLWENQLTALWCPICHKKIAKKLKTLTCIQGHSFDLAKEGYVNLLLSNQKHSKDPGDSKEMLQARSEFLDKGYYQGISDRVNASLMELAIERNPGINIADIGCGEGYYLSNFISHCQQTDVILNAAYGLDISKSAIQLAAKRTQQITWMVGNVFSLPFKDNALDVLLCMFAMLDFAACKRVLRKDAKLVRVSAGPDHLRELREIIYPKIMETEIRPATHETSQALVFEKSIPLKYETCIQNTVDLSHLLKMTPHYWKATKERKEAFYSYTKLNVTVDIAIDIWRK